MPVSKSESKKCKRYVKRQLSEIMPALTKIGIGDFSVKLKIPKKEDEFTELLVSLNLMIEELKAAKEAERKAEKARNAAEIAEIKVLTETKTKLEEKIRERTKELQDRVDELEKFNKIATGRELKMVVLKEEIEKLKKELKNVQRSSNSEF